MLKKKKTAASGELVLVKIVRRTRSRRMKFCVQRGLGALPSTSIACRFSALTYFLIYSIITTRVGIINITF